MGSESRRQEENISCSLSRAQLENVSFCDSLPACCPAHLAGVCGLEHAKYTNCVNRVSGWCDVHVALRPRGAMC